MPSKKRKNLFYILLIPVGIVFVVTACAYGYMAFTIANAAGDAAKQAGHPLFSWLRTNGDWLMLTELGVLAVLTIGAMVLEAKQDADESQEQAE
ncbi:MAG: hypothetical protein RIB44_02745 [Lacipirellulaceae bacterium]